MKILLLTHYYAPERGAPQQRWSALVERFIGAGHQVHVVAPAPHYPFGYLLPGAAGMRPGSIHSGSHRETVHRVSFLPYSASARSRMADEAVAAAAAVKTALVRFSRWRPDVVVATVPSLAMLAAGTTVAAALRVPFVADMRDAWPDLLEVFEDWNETIGTRPTPGRGPLARFGAATASHVVTSLQRRADAVVATTDGFAEALRSRGIPNVHVIRNGAHPLAPQEQTDVGPGDKTLKVLYAGTLGRAQGLATAIRAAALTHQRGAGITLRFVGSGAESRALADLATSLRAPVEFVPQVSREEIPAHHHWADSLLVSLRAWPGLLLTVPSKLYEAMSVGMHITASVAGEAAEIVRSTRAGDVAHPGDVEALAQLWEGLATDRSRLEVGDEGRAWVAEHSCDEQLARRYESVLEEVTRGNVR